MLIFMSSVSVSGGAPHVDGVASEDESIPIVVVIPGLTSDSSSQVSVSIQTLFFIHH